MAEAPSPLFCVEVLGLKAGPPAEGVVFQPTCLDRFDGPHHAHGRREQLALLERQPIAQFLAAWSDKPQDQNIDQRDCDAERGQGDVVDSHGGGEQDHRHQAERIGGNAA